jgi:hypothetical protein
MMETKQHEAIDQLQQAVLQAGLDAVNTSSSDADANDSHVEKKAESERRKAAVSPKNGAALPPGKGRPPGVRNRLTNLRDAVLEAFDRVGGADYLVRLAEGTQSDRAAFVSLMNKVLPTQINQSVDGGIKLELSWLGGRSIGTTTAQIPEQRTQVLDLEQDSDGGYRIKDPAQSDAGGDAAGQGDAGGDKA